jgi:hypothetical protein
MVYKTDKKHAYFLLVILFLLIIMVGGLIFNHFYGTEDKNSSATKAVAVDAYNEDNTVIITSKELLAPIANKQLRYDFAADENHKKAMGEAFYDLLEEIAMMAEYASYPSNKQKLLGRLATYAAFMDIADDNIIRADEYTDWFELFNHRDALDIKNVKLKKPLKNYPVISDLL